MARDSSTWHPIMATEEYEPGRWVMIDGMRHPYGMISFVRRGGEVGYRADRWAQKSQDRELVGYFRSLRAAAAAVHTHFIASHSPESRPVPQPRSFTTKANTPARTERD